MKELMSDTGSMTSPGTILKAILDGGIKESDRAGMEAMLQDTCAIADALSYAMQTISEEQGGLEKFHEMLSERLSGKPTSEVLTGDDDGVS